MYVSLSKSILYQFSNSLIFLSALNETECDGRVIRGEEAVSKKCTEEATGLEAYFRSKIIAD